VCHSQFVYSDAFITRVLEGMSQAVNRFRARLVVQPVSLRETNYLDIARRDKADGIILINAHDEDPALTGLANEGFPTVSMDFVGDIAVDQVYVDNTSAAREVTEYLIGVGHKRIGMITHASPHFYAARKRVEGYREALEGAGIPYDPELVRNADFSEQSGFTRMQELLSAVPDMTAVFAGNDVIAFGALQAAQQSNLLVPEDISIAGFDDDYMSRFLNPPLTTMVLPAAGHGAAAVEVLADRISGKSGDEPVRRVLSAHINVRESTGPPRGAGTVSS
jgi:LacI family transcriptional regulator